MTVARKAKPGEPRIRVVAYAFPEGKSMTTTLLGGTADDLTAVIEQAQKTVLAPAKPKRRRKAGSKEAA